MNDYMAVMEFADKRFASGPQYCRADSLAQALDIFAKGAAKLEAESNEGARVLRYTITVIDKAA